MSKTRVYVGDMHLCQKQMSLLETNDCGENKQLSRKLETLLKTSCYVENKLPCLKQGTMSETSAYVEKRQLCHNDVSSLLIFSGCSSTIITRVWTLQILKILLATLCPSICKEDVFFLLWAFTLSNKLARVCIPEK